MSTYAVSDFSFNIGTTDISQQYVPLVKQDVPWGINSTYIYKAPTLANQFNVNNKHLVIENQCLSGNIVFKTKDTGRIIINDLSVGTINGVPYSGNGSVSLTANSVNSFHIIDGSILGIDLSNGSITEEKLDPNLISKLFEFDRRISNLENPGWYGTLKVKNTNASGAIETFSFTLEAFTTNSRGEVNTVNLHPFTVLNRNQEVIITRPIQSRLVNKDTALRFTYELSTGDRIRDYDLSGLTVTELTETYITMTVESNFIHNGTIRFDVTVVE